MGRADRAATATARRARYARPPTRVTRRARRRGEGGTMPRLSDSFTIGGLEIAALSDGAPDRALGGFFHDVDPAAWTSAIGITDPEDPVPFNFGSFLIRGDGHLTLIDSGYGVPALAMGIPGGGELPQRIADLGVGLEEIDRVIHTHLHGDHVGWNIHDNEGDRLMFPNATFYVHENELAYWTGSASDDNPMAENVRRRINPVVAAGRVETTEGEFAVSEALTMVPAPGHTPGHCTVLAASQGTNLLLLGDAAHHPVHLEHHDWIPQVDLDPAESTRSRGKIARLAIEKDAIVTSGHFPILSLGRIREVEGGYKWELIEELG
ncbi:MAG: MBL fold metallo-hydrolase [Chloroflexi bacterium]|nr:MBL fold metallo-hydrolase [Chloroflexota bacterium]